MRMHKTLLTASLFALLLAGCSPEKNNGDTKKPAVVAPNSSSVIDKNAKTTLPAAPALSIATSFSSPDFCRKAGYDSKQCDQAYSVAFAMNAADAPKYKTLKECTTLFMGCFLDTKSKQYSPKMAGFSVAGQEKGSYTTPSKDKPIYFLPLYQTAAGKLAEIKQFSSGIIVLPVGEKMTARLVNPSGVTKPKANAPQKQTQKQAQAAPQKKS